MFGLLLMETNVVYLEKLLGRSGFHMLIGVTFRLIVLILTPMFLEDCTIIIINLIRVALCDLRTNKSTFLSVEIVEMHGGSLSGLLIPPGVAHGFLTLTEATVNYIVSNYYDGKDEHGVAWDDPELGVPWEAENPQVSFRDQRNPLFRELNGEALPG